MKRKNILWIAIALVLIVLCGVTVWKHLSAPQSFSLSDCWIEWENFASDMVVGEIHDQKSAVQQAEIVFIEVFGVAPSDYKPYEVLYDAESDVWWIFGTLTPQNGGVVFGRTPNALIRSDGDVLAVWNG